MRKIADIASEIEVFLHVDLNEEASKSLLGMHCIESTEDMHDGESGLSIVRRFLSFSSNWRGQHARRLKNELERMIR